MTITVSQVESVTTARLTSALSTSQSWTLTAFIVQAVRRIGYTTADITTVTDSDLSIIPDTHIDALLCAVEYYALSSLMSGIASSSTASSAKSVRVDQRTITYADSTTSQNAIGELIDRKKMELDRLLMALGISTESTIVSTPEWTAPTVVWNKYANE